MKASELRNFTLQELDQKYNSLHEQIFNLRTEKQAGRIEKSHKLKQIRRDIARIKTVVTELAQKELTAQSSKLKGK